jgi:hypothetical protein
MPTPHRPELNALFDQPPAEAITYLESKGYKIGWDWHQTLDDAHSRAFTVAKVAKLDLLQDIRQSLLNALEQGQSLEQWKSEITPMLQRNGWWGKKTVINPKGQEQLVQLGSPRRLRTIYHTNMRSAYSAGRYKAMLEATATRPFWEYRHVTVINYREEHKAWNGRILRADDPFWSYAYPPSKFGCNCRVIARSARDVEGREILSSVGYQTQYSEKIGIDSFTGADVYGTRQRFDIATQDGSTISFSPAAGFNNSPATSYAIDQVLADRTRKYMGDAEGLKQVQQMMLAPVRQRAHQAFIDNTLAMGQVQNKLSSIGVLQSDELSILTQNDLALESPIILMRDDFVLDPFGLTQSDLVDLPQLLSHAQAVFWDKQQQQLVYQLLIADTVNYAQISLDGGIVRIIEMADTSRYTSTKLAMLEQVR